MNSEQPFTVSTRGSSPVIDVSDGNDVSDLHNMLEMEDEAELDLDIFGEGRYCLLYTSLYFLKWSW